MYNRSAFNTGPVPADMHSNTVSDWAGQNYSLSCDKFGDMSWTPVDGDTAVDPMATTTNQNFPMDLPSQQYDMPLQPYETIHLDTLAPAELDSVMTDDAASCSMQSWPVSPSSLPGTFSDVATASTHTSPDDRITEPSSSRRHSYHQQQQSKSKPKEIQSKRQGRESVGNSPFTSKSLKSDPQSTTAASTTTASTTRGLKKTIREKNRTAATKYRNKTRKRIEELQEAEALLSEKHRILSAHVEDLRNEILSLKTEVLRHGTCDSPLISEYIMKTAKQL
ncbi:cyclic AMP-dependent transcription factor ATF-4 [Microdochium nivale]|nr:cyclic AMP-dependent transcription factor ATF-4 [Microdochium nivale]